MNGNGWITPDEVRSLEIDSPPRPELLLTVRSPIRPEELQRLKKSLEAFVVGNAPISIFELSDRIAGTGVLPFQDEPRSTPKLWSAALVITVGCAFLVAAGALLTLSIQSLLQ
jgi:hypothetical protein